MPETPVNPQPQSPKPFEPVAPWLRDLVKDKPAVVPVAPKLGVPPVVEEPKKEEVAPVAPIVEKPVVPVVPAPVVTPVAPVSTAPASPLK